MVKNSPSHNSQPTTHNSTSHNTPSHNPQNTKSPNHPLTPFNPGAKKTNPLPSSLRQAQDDNNGIKRFLEPYTLNSKPTHSQHILSPSHNPQPFKMISLH